MQFLCKMACICFPHGAHVALTSNGEPLCPSLYLQIWEVKHEKYCRTLTQNPMTPTIRNLTAWAATHWHEMCHVVAIQCYTGQSLQPVELIVRSWHPPPVNLCLQVTRKYSRSVQVSATMRLYEYTGPTGVWLRLCLLQPPSENLCLQRKRPLLLCASASEVQVQVARSPRHRVLHRWGLPLSNPRHRCCLHRPAALSAAAALRHCRWSRRLCCC